MREVNEYVTQMDEAQLPAYLALASELRQAGISPLAADIDWSLCEPALHQMFQGIVAEGALMTDKLAEIIAHKRTEVEKIIAKMDDA